MHESESEVTQLCPTLSDPMDCSLTGSPIHGIFQARVLEWGAIVFSDITYIWNLKEWYKSIYSQNRNTYRLRKQTYGYQMEKV